MLEETDTENVTVTVVVTGSVLVEVSIIPKHLILQLDVNILYVLVVFTDVYPENVMDALDVRLTLTDQTYQTSVHLVEDVDRQTLVGGVVVHQQTHVV